VPVAVQALRHSGADSRPGSSDDRATHDGGCSHRLRGTHADYALP
jgi:hypothetical protein